MKLKMRHWKCAMKNYKDIDYGELSVFWGCVKTKLKQRMLTRYR
jgi:hypothetical protein